MILLKRVLYLTVLSGTVVFAADTVGTTRIAQWKDDKACAFILMFDDNLNTHVKNVLPELQKRGFTGSFYTNPGSGHYGSNRDVWEKTLPEQGFELGNHTFTHKGGATKADVVEEITTSNEVIRVHTPHNPWPRLVSFAKPGGLKQERWPLTKEDYHEVLSEHHLILRPTFSGRGAQIAFKTGEQMLAHVDKAVKNEGLECIIFHGVGGDWISFPLDEFILFLDGLKEREESVWVTQHMAAYKYEKERDAASIQIVKTSSHQISLQLMSDVDPELYDQKLTLKTAVPTTWKTGIVRQGTDVTEVTVQNGVVLYDALPGKEPITITKQ
ncbi:MAG: polysaccharide deacetylase family protein [Kiritimatiellae bacterium]|jgi:peptidoglycan/xylan/chitin deacetylase (PgdA/CDA1 family)|nr:polysaccharide deacetylase family protein [Kiritimatiellia bacterium]